MIQTRILVGSVLALAAIGILVGDGFLSPWFPCLFFCLMAAGLLAGHELVSLFPTQLRPSLLLVVLSILACLAANWYPVVRGELGFGQAQARSSSLEAFLAVFVVYVAVIILSFLVEMYRHQGPGHAVARLSSTLLAVSYLGVLPCFFTQIRFLPTTNTGLLLATTILVPKLNDVAAFFTGTFIGRHRMTPLLSPKKTWEGFAGGMLGSIAAACGMTLLGESLGKPLFPAGLPEAVVFGLAVGVAGVLGDLAESLIKRDCLIKDASKRIPGFGGLLDVVDSVLFAAPVAFLWFFLRSPQQFISLQ
jgi:phosphatidate cytidylyltransferase